MNKPVNASSNQKSPWVIILNLSINPIIVTKDTIMGIEYFCKNFINYSAF